MKRNVLLLIFFCLSIISISGCAKIAQTDTTAPTAGSFSPSLGAVDIDLAATISAVFSKDMDSSTITTSTFTLTSAEATVPGSVSYDAATRTARFTPIAKLRPNVSYQATLSNSIKDTSGNQLAGGYNWSFTTFGWQTIISGFSGWVYNIAFDPAGNMYAGGCFASIEGVAVNGIAKWDGSTWSALGSGISGAGNYVKTIVFDSSGNLYIGGSFTHAGGVAVNNIAKWDGSSWSALGTGANAHVWALAFDALGNLYAGGSFGAAGGVFTGVTAKWNGTTWSVVGTVESLDSCSALQFDNSGNLYAGGLVYIGGTLPRIRKWNGLTWSNLGSGVDSNVNCLAKNGNSIYVGGAFGSAGGLTVNSIAKWDGTSWSALGSGIQGSLEVNSLAIDSSGNLFAGGNFNYAGGVLCRRIAKWDGASWSAVNGGIDKDIESVVFSPTGDLYIAGMDVSTSPYTGFIYKILK